MGMGATSMHKSSRTTASTHLADALPNLAIMFSSLAAKVLLSGKRATGVRTIDGRDFLAKRDVILPEGALNSSQLLMLSGIGPAREPESPRAQHPSGH